MEKHDENRLKSARSNKKNVNILIFYNPLHVEIKTIAEHLISFKKYSKFNIFYYPGSPKFYKAIDLDLFDAIIIHYSLRIHIEEGFDTLPKSLKKKIMGYSKLKILFIQDEYDQTNTAKKWIKRLQFNIVFTCVPKQYIESIYPQKEFPDTKFIQVLTGYVSDNLQTIPSLPISERKNYINYRGRNLHWVYGDLGQEKWKIGQRMREICERKKIDVDIEWEEDKRIYGNEWYHFLVSAKSTLGTESGSNIFDYNGTIRDKINGYILLHPNTTYEDIYKRFLQPHDNLIKMNQVSPKLFEAIALKTTLILFKGEYSGILKPNIHYIPLAKDFSNVEEVIEKIKNDALLQSIANKAYTDIIKSQKYSYSSFIEFVDNTINLHLHNAPTHVNKNQLKAFMKEPFSALVIQQNHHSSTGSSFEKPSYASRLKILSVKLILNILKQKQLNKIYHNTCHLVFYFFPFLKSAIIRLRCWILN